MNSKCEHGMEFECTECLAKSDLLLDNETRSVEHTIDMDSGEIIKTEIIKEFKPTNMMTKFDLLLAYTVRKGEGNITNEENIKAHKLYEELGEFIMRYQK